MDMQGWVSLCGLRARLLAVGALVALLHGCGGGGGGGGSGDVANPSPQPIVSNYFPTTTGAVWIHKASDGSTYTLKVIGQQAVAEGQAATFQGKWSDLSEPFNYIMLATASEVKELGSLSSDGYERALGDVTLFRLPLTLGAEVLRRDKTIDAGIDIDGDQISDRLTLREVARVAAVESVVTAAGNFNNVVRIRSVTERTYRSSVSSRDVLGTFTKDEWYARDIGLVRYENTLKRDDGSESKFSYELSAYGVGALRSENQPPQVISATPAAGAVLSFAWGLQVQFSEELDLGTVNPQTIRVLDAQGNAVASSLQVFGRDVSVAFSNSLTVGRYEVQINGVSDVLGNPISSLRWSFDVDTVAPGVLSTLPVNDAVDVDPLTSIRIEFSEDINANSTQAAQFTLSEQQFCCTSIATQATLVGPRSIVITPSAPLKKRMRYTLGGVVYDKAGNGVVVQVSFTTVPEWFTFAKRPTHVVPARSTAVGDLTGDGRADLVVVPDSSANGALPLVVYPQRADGTLGDALPPTRLSSSCTWYGGLNAQVLDVNGDGRNDVVLSGDSCGGLVLLAGPSGDFERVVTIATTWVPRVRFADMNGDGRLDAITQSAPFSTETQLEVRLQLADGNFGPPQTAISAPVSDFAVADMNNDGRPDLVLVGALAPGRNVAWAPQLVGGGFGALSYLSHPVDANLQHVAVADLDGNGRLDVVAATASYNTSGLVVSLWSQTRDGSFGAAVTLSGREGVAGVSVADLDGDGRLDVVGHRAAGGLAVYRQTQAMTYAAAEFLVDSTGYGFSNPAYGDLNGDGKTDFVTQAAEVAYYIGAPALSAGSPLRKSNPTPVRREALSTTQR
jgi:hypothetical protein